MNDQVETARANVFPSLRYHDAPAAIEWLCRAFGFETRLVVPGPEGTVVHAQLVFGNGMIMLGSVRESESELLTTPRRTGGLGTQSLYVVVADPDAHCARAVAAGAEIALEIHDVEDRGRLYTCRDPEGHVWHFGSYDPWATV